jgi:hypothetical protein
MPYLIKGLGDIKEGRGAVGFAIEGVKDFVNGRCVCAVVECLRRKQN